MKVDQESDYGECRGRPSLDSTSSSTDARHNFGRFSLSDLESLNVTIRIACKFPCEVCEGDLMVMDFIDEVHHMKEGKCSENARIVGFDTE